MWALTRTNLARHHGMHLVFAVILGILVAVVYAVCSLATAPTVLHLLEKGVGHGDMFVGGLWVVLFVMAAFVVVFMAYLNSLLMDRRLSEFGLYRRLGMPAGRLGASLALEVGLCGLWGLVGGLLGGVLFSKLLAMALLRLCDIDAQVGLLISGKAMALTALGCVALLVALGVQRTLGVCGRDLTRFKPVDQAAIEAQAPGPLMKFGAVCGALILIAATSVIIQLFAWFSRMTAMFGGTVGLGVLLVALLAAEICGVYLLYGCTLPTALHGLMSTHWAQLARRQLLLARLYVRLRANRQSLWLTTWLTTATLVMLGSAAMLYQYGLTVVAQDVPLAVVATDQTHAQVEAKLAGMKPSVTLTTKLVAGHVRLKMRTNRDAEESGLYQVIRQSDYQRLQAFQKLPQVALSGHEAVLITINQTFYKTATWSNAGRVLTLTDSKQHFTLKALSNLFPMGGAGYFDRGLVVSDAAYAGLQAPTDTLYGYQPSTAISAKQEAQLATLADRNEYATIDAQTLAGKMPVKVATAPSKVDSLSRSAVSLRRPQMHEMHVVFGFVLFVLGLLGVVMLVATASILLLKQLAATFGGASGRKTLLRLGMPPADVDRVLHVQIMAVFGLPLVLGSITAAIGIRLLQVTLDGTSNRFVLIAFAVYTLVYLAFAWATAVKSDDRR